MITCIEWQPGWIVSQTYSTTHIETLLNWITRVLSLTFFPHTLQGPTTNTSLSYAGHRIYKVMAYKRGGTGIFPILVLLLVSQCNGKLSIGYNTALNHTTPHHIIIYYTILCYAIQYYTILCYTIPYHSTPLHYAILYYIILFCTILLFILVSQCSWVR